MNIGLVSILIAVVYGLSQGIGQDNLMALALSHISPLASLLSHVVRRALLVGVVIVCILNATAGETCPLMLDLQDMTRTSGN
jgi:hypothetical protein